jgi:hypothetical protein
MKAGMPLDVNLKEITPPGTRMNRVIVHYADTYEQVVNDMKESGLPVKDELLEQARGLDTELRKASNGT